MGRVQVSTFTLDKNKDRKKNSIAVFLFFQTLSQKYRNCSIDGHHIPEHGVPGLLDRFQHLVVNVVH
jgi:hypothetical protein